MIQTFPINKNHAVNSFDERIKFLILHFTARDFKTSLQLLKNQVSSHYLISDSPVEILQLVDENKRAWHAGESFWAGRTNLNDSSIGIEIVNLDGNKNTYPEEQIDATIFLCKQIITRYNIAPDCVLGQSDIAPLRKDDPGSLFPWGRFYENGVGSMPDLEEVEKLEKDISLPNALELQKYLAKYGYQIAVTGDFDDQTKLVLDAFRRHFCPNLLGREIDKKSYATLLALLNKYK